MKPENNLAKFHASICAHWLPKTPVQKTEKRPTDKRDRTEDTVDGRYFRNVFQLDGINYR